MKKRFSDEQIIRIIRAAIRQHSETEIVTIDKSGANTAALEVLNAGKGKDDRIKVSQSKNLNILVEQDQRNIKRRIKLMTGFKSFRRAQADLAGIEIIHILREGPLQHPHVDGFAPAEQFYLLVAEKINRPAFRQLAAVNACSS